MKPWLLPTLLPAVCLCILVHLTSAQKIPDTAITPAVTGRIAGVIKDPTGAVIPDATVKVKNVTFGMSRSRVTNISGNYIIDNLSSGLCQITVTANGFETAIIRNTMVIVGAETTVNITLKIARVKTTVEVSEPQSEAIYADRHSASYNDRAHSRNAAEIVADAPGVSLRENGQLASIPFLHGLGDERAKLVVNGVTISSACANHMNPPLSYIAPAFAAQITVMAGITPVSQGGDSLGGTVSVESRTPVFAAAGEILHKEGTATSFYRSNGQNYGGLLTEWVAGRNLGIGYAGSWANNDDYTDGGGHKVTSSYAQTTDQTVTVAAQSKSNLIVIEANLHHIPYEGFVNAQMDMVRNYAESINLHYRSNLSRGVLDAHIFWQNTWHSMNIGKDKSNLTMPMFMPMNTHGRDAGYSVKYEAPLTARQALRVGNELQRFVLEDRWPPVPGTAPMMGPDTFVSINNGRRIRLGSYAELASNWKAQWTTLIGLRNDTVWTNAGPVQGYSIMYEADAAAFNALNRAYVDPDFDATAQASYKMNTTSFYEFGYARKTRAPNLYERYAWSTNMMASGMIGWFGDGNYYVGNVNLKPEVANTLSITANWHDAARRAWEIKLTPYETAIQNYIDVDTKKTVTYGMSTFAQLQFANHNARIYGADFSSSSALWKSDRYGQGRLSGIGGWLHGERLDTHTPLYQMMPVNASVNFVEELKEVTAGVGVQAGNRKRHVDQRRYEKVTPGYMLINLHTSYQHGILQANAAVNNLLNKCYELPMGGVNFDDFMASGWISKIRPLTGRGRSASFSLTARF